MKRLAVLLALSSCTPDLTPAQEAELDYRLAITSRDRANTLKHLDRAIAANPRPEYYAQRARVRLSMQDERAALADYSAGIALNPADPSLAVPRAELLLSRALLLSGSGRRAEAEDDLSEAVRLVPGYTEAWLERARQRRRLGRPNEADADVAEARRTGVERADGYYNEAVRAITKGDNPEAERMIGFALDLDPGHSRAHVAMARLHMERHRFDEAAKELNFAIPVHPREADLYYHRGTALLAAGRPADACPDFEKAVELEPKNPSYLAGRGLAKYRSGQGTDTALSDLADAITVDPACYAAWFNRGVIEQDRKDLDAAEKAFRRATSIRASPEGSIALGRVLHDRERYDMALDLYRQALEIYQGAEVQKALRDELERTRRAKEAKP